MPYPKENIYKKVASFKYELVLESYLIFLIKCYIMHISHNSMDLVLFSLPF